MTALPMRKQYMITTEEDAEKEMARIEEGRAKTAEKARRILDEAPPARPNHPYLLKKGVKPHGVREVDGELVVPMYSNGALQSLQTICADGEKRFLPGGRVSGCYYPIGNTDGAKALCIAEGFATAASIHEATGYPVAVAFNAGNLRNVACAMREKFPGLPLILCADDDRKTPGNPGMRHAKEAAEAVGGLLAFPDFGKDRPEDATDFNDMARQYGPEAVRRCIEAAKPVENADLVAVWPDPQPLAVNAGHAPFPLDALPPTIRAAVEEVVGFVNAPVPLVASSALSAVSLSGQALVNVKRAKGLSGPSSLFLLTIANSSERKSTCDEFFTKAIRAYEEAQMEAAKHALREYKTKIEAWEAKRGGIKDKIRQLSKDNKPTDRLESELHELDSDKPEPPRTPRLLYVDATPEALAYGLATKWPSGGVISAEAGAVFGSHGMGKESIMRTLSLLNQLWGGESTIVDRRTTDSFAVIGARLTVGLQVQEPTLREFFTRSGELARGTGFLARFLTAWPKSTAGQRSFTEPPDNWPHLDAFNRRITRLLETPVPLDANGKLTPSMLSFTPEAKEAWVQYHDAVEGLLASGGDLHDIQDVAGKSAENAARLAALFHLFEGYDGDISEETFGRASRIAAWYLYEARRFFGELALPAELADATKLDSWLIEHCKREKTHIVPTRDAQRLGPIRDKERLADALRELEELDRVRVVHEGRRKVIKVNPALLGVD